MLKSHKALDVCNIVVYGQICDVMFNDYSIQDIMALRAELLRSQIPWTHLFIEQSQQAKHVHDGQVLRKNAT